MFFFSIDHGSCSGACVFDVLWLTNMGYSDDKWTVDTGGEGVCGGPGGLTQSGSRDKDRRENTLLRELGCAERVDGHPTTTEEFMSPSLISPKTHGAGSFST